MEFSKEEAAVMDAMKLFFARMAQAEFHCEKQAEEIARLNKVAKSKASDERFWPEANAAEIRRLKQVSSDANIRADRAEANLRKDAWVKQELIEAIASNKAISADTNQYRKRAEHAEATLKDIVEANSSAFWELTQQIDRLNQQVQVDGEKIRHLKAVVARFEADKSIKYGGDETIHPTGHLDVGVFNGEVESVWFRCMMLPFKVCEVDFERVGAVRRAYKENRLNSINAIEFNK